MACVYRHIRKDFNIPFYIGIGVSNKRAYSKTHRNIYWNNIVNKTDYEVEILLDEIEYEYAKEKEIEFISLYKRKTDGGTLCNITLGGDGALGIKHTEEAKLKMSIPNRGKLISEEHRDIISKTHKGKKRSEETKKKMSESKIGEKNSRYGIKVLEETKQKMRKAANRGEENSSSKLNNLDVLEIRKLYNEKISSRKLSKIFNISKTNILSIVNKKTWKHI
jgi:group I intron endonuclease